MREPGDRRAVPDASDAHGKGPNGQAELPIAMIQAQHGRGSLQLFPEQAAADGPPALDRFHVAGLQSSSSANTVKPGSMSNRSAVLSRKTRVMKWSSRSVEKSTLKNMASITIRNMCLGRPLDFWPPPAGAAPSGARGSCRFHPALPGWATFYRASGAGMFWARSQRPYAGRAAGVGSASCRRSSSRHRWRIR